jgi:hypothetical protein
MEYINRLDNFDGPDIAKIAASEQHELYEEVSLLLSISYSLSLTLYLSLSFSLSLTLYLSLSLFQSHDDILLPSLR